MRNDAHYPLLLENRSTILTAATSLKPQTMNCNAVGVWLEAGSMTRLLRQHARVRQTQALIKPEHDIHVLHRLTRCAFNQVVDD
jgi:hypothetical protein